MAARLVLACGLLGWGTMSSQVIPDCHIDGSMVFTADSSPIDISSQCTTTFGAPFSIAWTQQVATDSDLSSTYLWEFTGTTETVRYRVTTGVVGQGTVDHLSSGSSVAQALWLPPNDGAKRRYLATYDGAVPWMLTVNDGTDDVGVAAGSAAMTSDTFTMQLGTGGFIGTIEDVYIWHELVTWQDAAVQSFPSSGGGGVATTAVGSSITSTTTVSSTSPASTLGVSTSTVAEVPTSMVTGTSSSRTSTSSETTTSTDPATSTGPATTTAAATSTAVATVTATSSATTSTEADTVTVASSATTYTEVDQTTGGAVATSSTAVGLTEVEIRRMSLVTTTDMANGSTNGSMNGSTNGSDSNAGIPTMTTSTMGDFGNQTTTMTMVYDTLMELANESNTTTTTTSAEMSFNLSNTTWTTTTGNVTWTTTTSDILWSNISNTTNETMTTTTPLEALNLTNATENTTTGTTTTATNTTLTTSTTTATSTINATNVSSDAAEANALQAAVAAATATLLKGLGNKTSATMKLPGGGTVTVTKLSALFANLKPGEKVAVGVPEAGMEVSIPADVFNSFVPEGTEAVLAVAAPEVPPGEVKDAKASISLLSLEGAPIKVTGLTTPVVFSMPAKLLRGMICSYWDDDAQEWLQDGVTLDAGAVLGGQVFCATTHFTLFRSFALGFLDAIECAQFSLFTQEALDQMSIGSWAEGTAAQFLWVLCSIMVLTFSCGAITDHHRRSPSWRREELFMLAEKPGPPQDDDDTAAAGPTASFGPAGTGQSLMSRSSSKLEEIKQAWYCAVCTAIGAGCYTIWECCKETALGDCLDEVMSEWFENFGEVREVVSDLCTDVECGAPSAGRVFQVSRSAMTRLVITSSTRNTAAHLGLSLDSVDFVLNDKDLRDMLVERHLRKAKAKVPVCPEACYWRKCSLTEEAWCRLHADVADKALLSISDPASHPCKVWQTFKLYSPIGIMFSVDIFTSCKMRALFHLMEMAGAVAVVCLFFVASGSLKGKHARSKDPSCGNQDLQDDLAYIIGRDVAVALGSVVVAGLPVSLLEAFHTRSIKTFEYRGCPEWERQLRTWRVQDRCIWVVGTVYIVLIGWFIALFCANISDEDMEEWARTGVTTLIWDEVLIPLLMSAVVPALADLLVLINYRLSGTSRSAMTREAQHKLLSQTNVMLPLVAI